MDTTPSLAPTVPAKCMAFTTLLSCTFEPPFLDSVHTEFQKSRTPSGSGVGARNIDTYYR